MNFVLVVLAVALACGIAFGIVVLVTGDDPGLMPLTASGKLPADRPLSENDVSGARFDTGMRGYRTTQVDEALDRLAYDIGFKDELIKVLASEVNALRDGKKSEADALREARRRALGEAADSENPGEAADPESPGDDADPDDSSRERG